MLERRVDLWSLVGVGSAYAQSRPDITINTPSMLCVADYLDALAWVDSLGGVQASIQRSQANLKAIEDFVAANEKWISFLAQEPAQRSNTSVCLSVAVSAAQVKQMVQLLETEGVAYDIAAYKDAPAGLRIWCGATVEAEDVAVLMQWVEWAYRVVSGTSD